MRILVAGASGAVGKALVPLLVSRGHAVIGLTRNAANAPLISSLGATPAFADALDRTAVLEAFQAFRPEVVVHQLTSIPAHADLRDFDRVFAATNRLRTEGTNNLVEAARQTGVKRFVAQSFCGWTFARTGGPVKTESDPLDPNPLPAFRRTLEAIRHIEQAMEDAPDLRGTALRYGGFYGPGTHLSATGAMTEEVRRRRLPLVGSGGGMWSFIHIGDVASATAAAAEGDLMGTFNVVDDDPAPVSEWLPFLADALGATAPLRLPYWLGRLLLPKHLLVMMTEIRGASNAGFKRAYAWQPRFASWREGFRHGLA